MVGLIIRRALNSTNSERPTPIPDLFPLLMLFRFFGLATFVPISATIFSATIKSIYFDTNRKTEILGKRKFAKNLFDENNKNENELQIDFLLSVIQKWTPSCHLFCCGLFRVVLWLVEGQICSSVGPTWLPVVQKVRGSIPAAAYSYFYNLKMEYFGETTPKN